LNKCGILSKEVLKVSKILTNKSTSPKITKDISNQTRKWDLYFD